MASATGGAVLGLGHSGGFGFFSPNEERATFSCRGGEAGAERAAAMQTDCACLLPHTSWILTSLRGPHTTACESIWTASHLFLWDPQAKSGFYLKNGWKKLEECHNVKIMKFKLQPP